MKTVQSISTAVISLDMGTSSVRACLVDESLSILFQRSVNVRLDSGLDGRAEQDAVEIIDAVLTCLTDVNNWATSKTIIPEGFFFSNSVSSLVILDEKDRPIAPALTWADTRAAHEADSLKNHLGVELYKRTACRSKVL
jgi:gluconokinase